MLALASATLISLFLTKSGILKFSLRRVFPALPRASPSHSPLPRKGGGAHVPHQSAATPRVHEYLTHTSEAVIHPQDFTAWPKSRALSTQGSLGFFRNLSARNAQSQGGRGPGFANSVAIPTEGVRDAPSNADAKGACCHPPPSTALVTTWALGHALGCRRIGVDFR
jgi:hypothetical protein